MCGFLRSFCSGRQDELVGVVKRSVRDVVEACELRPRAAVDNAALLDYLAARFPVIVYRDNQPVDMWGLPGVKLQVGWSMHDGPSEAV
jgi:hypothetical protein